VIKAAAESDAVEKIARSFLAIGAADHGGEHHVFEGGEFGQKKIMLEDKTHGAVARLGALLRRDVVERLAEHLHVARVGTLQTAEDIEQGCFTRA